MINKWSSGAGRPGVLFIVVARLIGMRLNQNDLLNHVQVTTVTRFSNKFTFT